MTAPASGAKVCDTILPEELRSKIEMANEAAVSKEEQQRVDYFNRCLDSWLGDGVMTVTSSKVRVGNLTLEVVFKNGGYGGYYDLLASYPTYGCRFGRPKRRIKRRAISNRSDLSKVLEAQSKITTVCADHVPKRILVVGSPGAGKTTVANQLSRELGCPHIETDFSADPCLTQGDTWVIEGCDLGVIASASATADIILWLDFSPTVSLIRAFRRTLGALFGRQVDADYELTRFRAAFRVSDQNRTYECILHPVESRTLRAKSPQELEDIIECILRSRTTEGK